MLIPTRPEDEGRACDDIGTNHAVEHQGTDIETGQVSVVRHGGKNGKPARAEVVMENKRQREKVRVAKKREQYLRKRDVGEEVPVGQ